MRYVTLLFVCLLLVAGCPAAKDTLVFGPGDDGSRVAVPAGTLFVVQLPGNATTGYQWQVTEIDRSLVDPVGEPEYETVEDDAGRVGAPGVYTLKFKTLAPGESTLELGYVRPWEQAVPPAKTYTLTVLAGTMGRIQG